MSSFWFRLDLLLLSPQRNPLALLEFLAVQPRCALQQLWLIRMGLLAGSFALLTLVSLSRGDPWYYGGALALLPAALLGLLIGGIIPWSGEPHFWLLYLFSPLTIGSMVLAGLAPITPWALVGGWVVVWPLLVGFLPGTAGTVWIHSQRRWDRMGRVGWETGGPAADLPDMQRWLRVRIGAMLSALFLGGLALLSLNSFPPTGSLALRLSLMVAFFLAISACLHLESAFLSLLPTVPLVRYDAERAIWQPSYVGRTTLFVVPAALCRALHPDPPLAAVSARLLALLAGGPLSPLVRAQVVRWTADEVHCLIRHASFQAGGAAAIDHLSPLLDPTLRPLAASYAALAREAAHPFPQDWFNLLASLPPQAAKAELSPQPPLRQLLVQLQEACVTLEQSVVAHTLDELEQWCHAIEDEFLLAALSQYQTTGTVPLPDMSWPVALYVYLRQRWQLLTLDDYP